MKCHYEVLNVPRDADLAEIKAAYKKLALKWHPDKNLDNQDDAKEQFQLVQQAYEVLSDRQERAWYDNHREQILRGSNSDFEDNSLDVYQYFTTSCFRGYGDDKNGFYTVYRNIFETIAKEDLEFMEDKDEFCSIPAFGNSQSDYDDVVKPFYDYWMNYCTKKSFVWLDPYNINEMRDRRNLRLAEKENKKVRQQARKDRNEEVRALVAFVRKRDKRVQAHLQVLEAKRIENKQKVEQLKLQKKLERKEQLSRESGEADWAKFDNVKSALREIEKNLAKQFSEEISNSEDEVSEEEEEDEDNLYCVACNKVFKTPKTFKNHERSKKHKENVAGLKETLLDEEESEICNEEMISCEKNGTAEYYNSEETNVQSKKRNKKAKNKILTATSEDEIESVDVLNSVVIDLSESDYDFDSVKQKNKKPRKKTASKKVKEVYEKDDEEYNVDSQKMSAAGSKKVDDVPVDTNHCCVSCKSSFSSKNKLFDHLKKSGHSVYLPNSKVAAVKQKKKSVKEK